MRTNTILKTLVGISAAVAALYGAPAFAQARPTPAAPATAAAPAAPAAAAAASLSKGDQKIVIDMAMGNMAEVDAAKMAQGKTQNEQVKTFAQQMIDDHTKALADVQQLATAKGVTVPTELDKAHKAAADKLGAKSGAAFDKAYMAQEGVADHKKMHSMLASAEKKAKDPDVKALAAKMMPTVEQHLKSAQQMGSPKAKATDDKAPAATAAGK